MPYNRQYEHATDSMIITVHAAVQEALHAPPTGQFALDAPVFVTCHFCHSVAADTSGLPAATTAHRAEQHQQCCDRHRRTTLEEL